MPDVNWSGTRTQLSLAFQSVWDHIRIYTQKLTRWKLEPLDYCCYSVNALTWVLDLSSFNHSFLIYVELHFNPTTLYFQYVYNLLLSAFFSLGFYFLLKSFCFVSVRTTFNVNLFFWHFLIIGLGIQVRIRALELGTCVEYWGELINLNHGRLYTKANLLKGYQ